MFHRGKHAKPLSYAIANTIAKYWLIFIIGCILGFCYETVNDLICGRGLMLRVAYLGPWCPIYGVGCVLINILFEPLRDNIYVTKARPVLIAILIAILVTAIELTASYICESFMGYCPWDYSDYMLNFQGRIALKTTLIFVIGGMVMLYGISPLIDKALKRHTSATRIVAFLTAALFAVDTVLEFNGFNTEFKHSLMRDHPFLTIQGR